MEKEESKVALRFLAWRLEKTKKNGKTDGERCLGEKMVILSK